MKLYSVSSCPPDAACVRLSQILLGEPLLNFSRAIFSRTLWILLQWSLIRLRAPELLDSVRNVSAPALPQYPISAWRRDESGRRWPCRKYVATTLGASLFR